MYFLTKPGRWPEGAAKIGTTGRGIGPAYEDKVGRRAIRMVDIFDQDVLRTKLQENVAYYAKQLEPYGVDVCGIQCDSILSDIQRWAERLRSMVSDVPSILYRMNQQGETMLFEGAQGTFLDVDHGSYPFVTSSNCVAGAASLGAGVSPHMLGYVLGITKAYITRVGSGPFPTELSDDMGSRLAQRGHEFGSVTGRARRCGWFDAALLRRSVQINGVSGLCLTKLDVLDGLDRIKICTGYRVDGEVCDVIPFGAERVARCEPIYEEMPGWSGSTFGISKENQLPTEARAYLGRLEELCEVPIDVISTGPDRIHTIVRRHPFGLS